MYTKNVIKLSQAWIAALFLGLFLTGCGGSGSDPQSVDRSATLNWNAPSLREDGETTLGVGDLKSYIISYGQDPENLKRFRLEVEQGHQHPPLEYTFENLSEGEWHFYVQAEDKNGLTSAPSEMVSKTI